MKYIVVLEGGFLQSVGRRIQKCAEIEEWSKQVGCATASGRRFGILTVTVTGWEHQSLNANISGG